jgi:hypothetical protein
MKLPTAAYQPNGLTPVEIFFYGEVEDDTVNIP